MKNYQQRLEKRIQDDYAHAKSRKGEPLCNKAKIPSPAKQIPSSKDSGIDTGTVCSSNMSPDTVKVNMTKNYHEMGFKGNVPEVGIDNTCYDEDSADSTIQNNLAKHNFKPFPDPYERINLLRFQELKLNISK